MATNLTFQIIVSGTVAGAGSKSISDNAAEVAAPVSVPAAQPATLSVRAGNTSGTLTMTNANHGLVAGQRIDLYWATGTCFGVIVATVNGVTVTFTTVQGGNPLPAVTTAITVGICTAVAFSVVGDNMTGLVCGHAQVLVQCYYVFVDALGVLDLAVLNAPNTIYFWDGTTKSTGPVGSGPTGSAGISAVTLNPLANTNPTQVWVSHANTAAPDVGLVAAALTH